MKIIGLAGTDASGKDTIGELLAEKHGWHFVSVSDILREELKKRGKTLKRENLRALSAQWRRKLGNDILINKAVQEFEPLKTKYKGLVLSSLRNPGEVEKIHELGGLVIWTDAEPQVRYERVMKRKRGTEDEVTFEEFQAEEAAQMHHKGDEATLNLNGVREGADIHIENNGNDLAAFEKQVEKAVRKFIA